MQFILQLREITYNLIEKWTEGGISGLREKSHVINNHKRNVQFHPQLKKHKLKRPVVSHIISWTRMKKITTTQLLVRGRGNRNFHIFSIRVRTGRTF